jgi:medium-chain acyl-[acyl-carrier-protein] hydrolase
MGSSGVKVRAFSLASGYDPSVQDLWLPLRKSRPGARIRLFCFPYAGGAASAFRSWSDALAPDIEVCALEYPGRWSRNREPPLVDARRLAELALQGVRALLDQPFALFGYSFGALVAFEFARALRANDVRAPEHLIVGARQAPQLPRKESDIHRLGDLAFLEAIDRRYGVLPAAVRNDPDLLEMVLPILRADITAFETYVCREEAPLACGIAALTGADDTRVDEAGLMAWSAQTRGSFVGHRLAGGHFFINTSSERVLQIVRATLAPAGSVATTDARGSATS